MSNLTRRGFGKSMLAAGIATAAPVVRTGSANGSPNDQVNVAIVGFNGRGTYIMNQFLEMPGVRVTALCDVDERLFPRGIKNVEEKSRITPKTEPDFRKLLEDKDIDAVAIATPDHWHALQTIWACQAGKDVYVEKPVCYTIDEGRKMVQAARKYDRVVQAGLNQRSDPVVRAAMNYLNQGEFGEVYRAKAFIFKGRASIGHAKDSKPPEGVHWDLFLGPAPYRPFNENRFHYGWHFFWDYSTTDVGNTGVHHLDVARWGMDKRIHPVRVHSAGGYYQWDSDQQTPNVQVASFEYADGAMLEVELSNLYTHPPAGSPDVTNAFYTTKGYVTNADGYQTYVGSFKPRGGEYTPEGIPRRPAQASFPERSYEPGPALKELAEEEGEGNNFQNFIDCVRTRRWQDLNAEILDGHMSTTLCHLANISFKTGRKLTFNPYSERFVNDDDANSYLTRIYRHPFIVPDEV